MMTHNVAQVDGRSHMALNHTGGLGVGGCLCDCHWALTGSGAAGAPCWGHLCGFLLASTAALARVIRSATTPGSARVEMSPSPSVCGVRRCVQGVEGEGEGGNAKARPVVSVSCTLLEVETRPAIPQRHEQPSSTLTGHVLPLSPPVR